MLVSPQEQEYIHTDFEKRIYRAEVIAYEDFVHMHQKQNVKKQENSK
jgi:ribosome-binding ATPase YchF (GTP1/OBG family)